MAYENIIYQVDDGIATITFNRPKALNALNSALLKEFSQALDALAADAGVAIRDVRDAGEALHDARDAALLQVPFAHAEELYDLQNDPDEIDNLAGNPVHAKMLERMRGRTRIVSAVSVQ